jgi:uncharacterized damage-inducible protein DinB
MKPEDLHILFDYNYWANGRILEAATKIQQDQYEAPIRISHGSLRGTLVHIMSAEWVWRKRCQEGVSPEAMLREADFPTVAALKSRWDKERAAMQRFLRTLKAEDLFRPVAYTTTVGVPLENALWHILVHVVNHGTQFRSEAGVLLSRRGNSPGNLDLIVYLRGAGIG